MQPLAGLRILEFDGLGPVTFAGMMLADLGADVLRLTRSASAGPAARRRASSTPARWPPGTGRWRASPAPARATASCRRR